MSAGSNPLVRSITGDKLVHSPFLNRIGLQILRTLAASAIHEIRPSQVSENIRSQVQQLRRDGVVVIPDFMPADVFERMSAACIAAIDNETVPVKLHDHGATKTRHARLDPKLQEQFEMASEFFSSEFIQSVFEAVEKKRFSSNTALWAIEHVAQGPADQDDREASLHSDIFYHTHKAWLYLTDVREQDGPLVFVRGSHRLSLTQLKKIYQHSLDPKESSRRILQEEIDQRGLAEEVMTCPKNTLVIANTCGYHRRKKGSPGGSRYALHVSMRTQPFLFWR